MVETVDLNGVEENNTQEVCRPGYGRLAFFGMEPQRKEDTGERKGLRSKKHDFLIIFFSQTGPYDLGIYW